MIWKMMQKKRLGRSMIKNMRKSCMQKDIRRLIAMGYHSSGRIVKFGLGQDRSDEGRIEENRQIRQEAMKKGI